MQSTRIGRYAGEHAFTVALLLAMLACAFATGTVWTRLSPQGLEQLGCSPADLFSARAWRALTSLPFTWGGLSFVGLLPLVAGSIGACERRLGTGRTVGVFLGTHVGSLVVEAVVLEALPSRLAPGSAATLLAARDVGPSAGCFGCLGALIALLPGSLRLPAAVGLALFLGAISFWRPDPGFASSTLWISDLAHPVAALAGYGFVALRRRLAGAGDAA